MAFGIWENFIIYVYVPEYICHILLYNLLLLYIYSFRIIWISFSYIVAFFVFRYILLWCVPSLFVSKSQHEYFHCTEKRQAKYALSYWTWSVHKSVKISFLHFSHFRATNVEKHRLARAFVFAYTIWAATCDFQQWCVLTSVDSGEPVQPPFKLRNSKWCTNSSLTLIEYWSDKQRLWSDCAYAQADLRLCWSHIPHCWKSHVAAK